ncbi:hypothetical protein CLV84_1641 [Neolewinella xylanilytica]|uniref:Uncharacterized protein n=1 Tax=Neolewinella xylanilytica TaxID=1514080 RepID=A0A2S6IAY8_9BACT|nr:hypothetical protein [Neolewinella xylanilytica]PPK88671.1 hypothetical protein CLV84_1641 [Neolewinella xylanilytica]
MILLLIISLLLVAMMVYMFNQWSRNRMPSKKQRARVVRELKADMDTWSSDLVKMNKEELDLFSLTQDKQVVKRGTGTTAKGTFTTIFHEPVVSYSYRKYLGKQVNELLYARTAQHDFVYWTENGITSLEIDDQPVGKIDNNVLLGQRTGKELARIEATPRENYLPVSVGNREVGALASRAAKADDPLSQRAFEFIPDDLNDKEEQLLMSLTMRELVRRSVVVG